MKTGQKLGLGTCPCRQVNWLEIATRNSWIRRVIDEVPELVSVFEFCSRADQMIDGKTIDCLELCRCEGIWVGWMREEICVARNQPTVLVANDAAESLSKKLTIQSVVRFQSASDIQIDVLN